MVDSVHPKKINVSYSVSGTRKQVSYQRVSIYPSVWKPSLINIYDKIQACNVDTDITKLLEKYTLDSSAVFGSQGLYTMDYAPRDRGKVTPQYVDMSDMPKNLADLYTRLQDYSVVSQKSIYADSIKSNQNRYNSSASTTGLDKAGSTAVDRASSSVAVEKP